MRKNFGGILEQGAVGSAQSTLPISGLRGCRHEDALALRARLRGFAAPLEFILLCGE
jgi:hypothetical protein